ncbi:MAG TPA: glycoside hydrolase N-terminal domain-containing protein [Lacipirellula sp.]
MNFSSDAAPRLLSHLSIALFGALHFLAGVAIAGEPSPGLQLWYDSPAEKWTEALPLGNGHIGAMVFGQLEEERIALNEGTLWTGGPRSYANRGAAEHLPEIRQLLFAGRQREAEELAQARFMSIPLRQMAFQPLGELRLHFPGHGETQDYRRMLDLDTAVATTSYRCQGVRYTRRVFASYPDRALVIHLTCDQPRRLTFSAGLSSPQSDVHSASSDHRTLELAGRVHDWQARDGHVSPGQVRFATHLRVLDTDGEIASDADQLRVSGASRATLILTAATSFLNYRDLSADAVKRSEEQLAAASKKKYDELEQSHIEDHQHLFRRVSLRLGDDPPSAAPTDQRIMEYARNDEPALAALFFQYGRYLMIASSRPGGQPANLQGIWNDQLAPPWESKYTININTQMNYWLTESCNLAECSRPLFDAIADLAESGRQTARAHYAADGWVAHHNFDLWRGTAPINNSNHGIWPTGGAWLCQHLWEHYQYGDDEQFLRDTAYPLMKASAQFFLDYLIDDPRDDANWLISGPSNSPEHGGLVMGPTMDHQIIRDLFSNVIEASEILDIDEAWREKATAFRDRIAPNKIGRHGQLQEWLEDVDDPANDHRHVSHLWALHPGDGITPDTPELFDAARRSLEFRGDGGTGWSRAWKVNLWARLRDGDRAHKVLAGLLMLTDSPKTEYRGGGVYANLFDAHPPFQIDGNFGAANGIAEMLLQSHRRLPDGSWLIELLPALPEAWPEGSVRGLRARGGFIVDIEWRDGKLVHCRVTSGDGTKACIAYKDRKYRLAIQRGQSVVLNGRLEAQDRD